jgi:hypothetical protein
VNRVPDRERILQQIHQERKDLTNGAPREKLLAYALTFHTEHGRAVLSDLEASYGGISFVPGYPDVGAFKEGRRSVLDDIRLILKTAEALEVAAPPTTDRR